jgi:hypothetical protein
MSAAVAEVDDVAAVALSMARLGVLDEAEARLASLRQRQRAMVDTLMAQLRAQREGLRCALNDVAPGLDGHNHGGGGAAALSSALDAAAAAQAAAERECVMEAEAQQGWRAALAWAKGQLPGVLAGALGACVCAAFLRFRWCAFGGCLLTFCPACPPREQAWLRLRLCGARRRASAPRAPPPAPPR